jgi:hypothetical protein
MANIIVETWNTYRSNLKLILLFSIPFLISLAIPILASVPTYVSVGGIFLRTASVFNSISPFSAAVIIISVFLSLLFISFAFVAISLIVKSKSTKTRNSRLALDGIEKYTARVFVVLGIYTAVIVIANIVGYYLGIEALLTALVGFFGFVFIFYTPTAIVIDDKKIWRAFKDSIKVMRERPEYFVLWLALIIIIISAIDELAILAAGTLFSMYIVLIINSLIVLPYFVIFQAEAYMKRFHLLRH